MNYNVGKKGSKGRIIGGGGCQNATKLGRLNLGPNTVVTTGILNSGVWPYRELIVLKIQNNIMYSNHPCLVPPIFTFT